MGLIIDNEYDNTEDDYSFAIPQEEEFHNDNTDDEKEEVKISNNDPFGIRRLDASQSFSVPISYPKEHAAYATIIQKFHDAGCPVGLYDDVMKSVHELVLDDVIHKNSTIPSYNATITNLGKSFNCPPPIMRSIALDLPFDPPEDFPTTVSFPTFSFVESLQDLLNSHTFEIPSNLSFPEEDPFTSFYVPKVSNHNINDEAPYIFIPPAELQDGSRYQSIMRQLISVYGKEELLDKYFEFGIILFVDKISSNDRMQVYGMEPLMFTLACLTEEQRSKPENWRCLGYIPKLPKASIKVGSTEKKIPSSFHLSNYHKVLDVLLEGIVKAQTEKPVVTLRVGNQCKRSMAHILVTNLIADGLAIDTVATRYNSHKGCPRICVSCHTSQADAAKTGNLRCQFFTQWGIEKMTIAALGPPLVERGVTNDYDPTSPFVIALNKANLTPTRRREQLSALNLRKKVMRTILHKVFAQHTVDNAFFKVHFPADPCGIFGLRSTEILHCVEEGLIPRIMSSLIDPLSVGEKNKLDALATCISNQSRPTMRDAYPEINLAKGFCNHSNLSADRRVGRLFLLMILLETPVGREIMTERCDSGFDEKRKKNKVGKKKKAKPLDGDKEHGDTATTTTVKEEEIDIDEIHAADSTLPEHHHEEEEGPPEDEDDGFADDNNADDAASLMEEEHDDGVRQTGIGLDDNDPAGKRKILCLLVLRDALGLEFFIKFMKSMDDDKRLLCYTFIWEIIRNKVKYFSGDNEYVYCGPGFIFGLEKFADRRPECFSECARISPPSSDDDGSSEEEDDSFDIDIDHDTIASKSTISYDDEDQEGDKDMSRTTLEMVVITTANEFRYPELEECYNLLYYDSIYESEGIGNETDEEFYRFDVLYKGKDSDQHDDDVDDDDDASLYSLASAQDANHSFDGTVDDLRILIWRVLSFHALVIYNGIHHHRHDTGALRLLLVRIDELIDTLKRRIRRGDGTLEWALQKMHELRHIVLDYIKVGHPRNVNANKCESGLKVWGKRPGKNARKSGNQVFNTSAANHLYRTMLVDKVVQATTMMKTDDILMGSPAITFQGIQMEVNLHGWKEIRKKTTVSRNCIDNKVVEFLSDKSGLTKLRKALKEKEEELIRYDSDYVMHQRLQNDIKTLKITAKSKSVIVYSEVALESENKGESLVVRGIQNFKSTGHWYDWVEVKYIQTKNRGKTSYEMKYPFQVLGFCNNPSKNEPEPCAVGYCGIKQTEVELSQSVGLVEHWRMENFLRIIPCETILCKRFGFILPTRGGGNNIKAYLVKDRLEDWGHHFMNGWE